MYLHGLPSLSLQIFLKCIILKAFFSTSWITFFFPRIILHLLDYFIILKIPVTFLYKIHFFFAYYIYTLEYKLNEVRFKTNKQTKHSVSLLWRTGCSSVLLLFSHWVMSNSYSSNI